MAQGVLIGANDLAYMHAHGMTEEMLGMMSGANDCGDGMMAAMNRCRRISTSAASSSSKFLRLVLSSTIFGSNYRG